MTATEVLRQLNRPIDSQDVLDGCTIIAIINFLIALLVNTRR